MSESNQMVADGATVNLVGRHTLLVVDDDRVQRMMLRRELERSAYRVAEAADGAAALNCYVDIEPDMVLLDVVMPEMDGFETCRRMRQIPQLEPIPILMLTGLNDTQAVDRAFEAGATDFISKPINWTMLSQRVRYALRAHDNARALKVSQQHLMHAQQLARLGYFEWTLESGEIAWSSNAAELLGLSGTPLGSVTTTLQQQVHPDDWPRVAMALERVRRTGGVLQDAFRIGTEDGRLRHMRCVFEGVIDAGDRIVRVSGSVQDITPLKQAEALIEYQLYHDGLTRLPNRRYFIDRLAGLIDHGGPALRLAVIVLDLDRFKIVNESLGAIIGDRLLLMLSERLSVFSVEGGLVARMGGDEFGVLIEQPGEFSGIQSLAEGIRSHVSQPFEIEGHRLVLTTSVGVGFFPKDSCDAYGLLACADAARARSKRAGGDQVQFFTNDLLVNASRRLRLENALRNALAQGQLAVNYQPIVKADDGLIVGAEALLRWRHPELGPISPAEFIPIAEETGSIIALGEWVLVTACRQASEWSQGLCPGFYISVNLSVRQLGWAQLESRVKRVLADTGLAPEQLNLEVTESLAMQNPEVSIGVLQRLSELGTKLSIDDFGTGHSSLNYLHKLPVTTIKIDRSFVQQLDAEQSGKGIVTTILGLARVLGLQVVAEGVETEDQRQFLDQHGCDFLQGYLFAPALTNEAFEIRLAGQGDALIAAGSGPAP